MRLEKIFSYFLTVVFAIFFLATLLVFHPIQWVCLNVFGYLAHKKSVDYMNLILIRTTHLLGAKFTFKNRHLVPKNTPIIFVANHQSMYDIIGIIWFMRKSHPKFVSKKELGKGIPSVSFNLRHGGSVLIDRKDSKQALSKIKELGEYIEKNKRAAVIFPEGTRSRDGKPKSFAQNGLKILCKYAPSAYIVPISINNSWKMVKFGAFPMGLGTKLEFTVHSPISLKEHSFEEIFEKTENSIKKLIHQN